MTFAIRSFILFFCFIFIQSIEANVCDFKLSDDYLDYLKAFEHNPYTIAINSPDTTIGIWQADGHKTVTIRTLIKEGCLEVSKKEFDETDSFMYSLSYVLKDYQLTQVVFNDTIINIVYGKTPCDFSVIKPSGESIVFDFNDLEDNSEYIKLEKTFPNRTFYITILHQTNWQCVRYKKYLEGMK
ncbi:MAG: hypothetical protein LBU56_02025 [Rickettsiales bacterium]|nr:hypothetical protein [Rickettsiales bacterium]